MVFVVNTVFMNRTPSLPDISKHSRSLCVRSVGMIVQETELVNESQGPHKALLHDN